MEPGQESRDAKLLLSIARHALEAGVASRFPDSIDASQLVDLSQLPDEFGEHRACFVTLRHEGALRGCIGSVEATRPLAIEVAEQALAAGFRDPRFPPLDHEGLEEIEISISILHPPERIAVSSRNDLLNRLRPGVDGLIVQDRAARGVFLPSVWEQLPTADAFVRHLMRKAGLPENHWSDDILLSRFETESISEIG